MHSLLWPGGRPPAQALARLGDEALRDLEADRLADALAQDRPDRRGAVVDLLSHLPLDPATVAWRAGTSADLLASAPLCARLEGVLRSLRLLAAHRPHAFPRDVPHAARIGARVVELAAYVDAVDLLRAALAGEEVRSPALAVLRADAEREGAAPEFVALASELPRWRRTLDEVRSVNVAINVSGAMEPESAAIVGFSASPVDAGETALARLLGDGVGSRGLARLFRRQPVDWQGDGRFVAEVQALLETVAAPVERALTGFRGVHAQALQPLEDELVLLLGGARLGRRWRALGLPCCIAGPGAETRIEGAFHPILAAALARPEELVPNDCAFGAEGRVWVLTGPNRGGKTTYLRAAAAVQILGQCGLPVPARRARLCPVDAVHTHFPAPEAAIAGQGRLDEEAARVARIFDACTPRSLVLLNEVLAGTSAPEGVALAADILRGFRALGCAVIYATHLHELALRCADINASLPGPARVASLTAEAAPDGPAGQALRRPTYRIVPGLPGGASFFASQIARQHGISLEQLLQRLRERGARPEGPAPSAQGAPGGPASPGP